MIPADIDRGETAPVAGDLEGVDLQQLSGKREHTTAAKGRQAAGAGIAAGPGQLEVDLSPTGATPPELEIYLRVWRVLYPDAEVQLGGDDGNDDPVPAA